MHWHIKLFLNDHFTLEIKIINKLLPAGKQKTGVN